MDTICRMRIRGIQLFSVLLSSIFVASGFVMAGEKPAPHNHLTASNRPAAMYKLALDNDAAICSPILASLNKPLTASSPFIDAPVDLVLKSDLEVSWQRKRVVINPISSDDLDFAHIDLANDGTLRAVYRWEFFMQNRGANLLFILPKALEGWSSSTSLREDVINELGARSNPPETSMREQLHRLLYERDQNAGLDLLDFNVVHAAGKYVMLAAGSGDVVRGIYEGRPFQVFALLYHASEPPSLLCQFRASP